ncbi:hypothetical protein T440DRAFT_507139 [Plenodomus tracheiphilus IPT5]|uniref:Uncharacterized protein n=1 Tax=Plenodomus tracheiphilus IPT5 TaxID=1408161 RepID=A0A6A7B8N1_9PLEO|nr:hypothetical protein T440DRAFT_507139 [Plenodomus tracheiphilus IPT5]
MSMSQRRTVFQTDVYVGPGPDDWQAYAAVELANSGSPIVLFRTPRGNIVDVTSNSDVQVVDGKVHIKRSYLSDGESHDGFEIIVTELETETASFSGTIERSAGHQSQGWRGSYVCFKDTPLDVIQKGRQEIPEQVGPFLGMNPLIVIEVGEHVDAVALKSAELLKELIMEALPGEAKELLYQNGIRDPDDGLRNVISRSQSYSAEAQFQNLIGAYRLAPHFDVVGSVRDYREALRRCYFAEYVNRCTEWDTVLNDPASKWPLITNYLLSDQFLEHWLPTLIDTVENRLAINLRTSLSILSDKLYFLLMAKTGQIPDMGEVQKIIQKLATSANQTGLVRGTMVADLDTKDLDDRMVNSPYAALPDPVHFLATIMDQRAADILERYAGPQALAECPTFSIGRTPNLRNYKAATSVMRLINTKTLELQWFNDDATPEYAILSHTWGPDEITYQELIWINRARALATTQEALASSTASFKSQNDQNALMFAAIEMMIRGNSVSNLGSTAEEDLMHRAGYNKITHAAREARSLGFNYIWCDVCCIDKSSSAELQEAINSMYRWYRDAEVCIVYLEDIARPDRSNDASASVIAKTAFEACRWTKRGWTLQELIAPAVCRFYFKDWTLMGEKVEYLNELSDVTGIPVYVLEERRSVSEVSVAERMSWAAHRESTRLEDTAYSLLGIFDIHMPLLYGEGEKAFQRLQEEILKTTDDYSLFAWCATTTHKSTYRGLLARSPLEFQNCRSIEREDVVSTFPIGSTPIGFRVQLEFLPDPNDKSRVLAMLRACNSMSQRLAIYLKCLDGSMQYARVDAGTLVPIDDWPTGQLKTIYVRQKLSIPADFTTFEFRSFHVVRRIVSTQLLPPVRIISAQPRELWNQGTHELRIPDTAPEMFGALLLRVQSPRYAHSLIPVAFGFNRSTCHYWCKAMTEFSSAVDVGSPGSWLGALRRRVPLEVFDALRGSDVRHDVFIDGDLGINVSIRAGLSGDSIVLQVSIDGLVKWQ